MESSYLPLIRISLIRFTFFQSLRLFICVCWFFQSRDEAANDFSFLRFQTRHLTTAFHMISLLAAVVGVLVDAGERGEQSGV